MEPKRPVGSKLRALADELRKGKSGSLEVIKGYKHKGGKPKTEKRGTDTIRG